MNKGIVRFLPLLIVAVLLVGVVGYVSVKEIKNSAKSAVLSDSTGSSRDGGSPLASETETETEIQKSSSGAGDINESELDTEDSGLNSVGSLEVDIPDVSTEIEAENRVLQKGTLTQVTSTQLQATEAGTPQVVRVQGVKNLKFLGLISVNVPMTIDVNSTTGEQLATIDEPFLLKYLDFLFTK